MNDYRAPLFYLVGATGIAFLLLASGCDSPSSVTDSTESTAGIEYEQMAQRISEQMRKPDRHKFDLPRDAGRKPLELFQFLGVRAGMTAMDVAAYAGYTTEMLAAAVGPQGRVYMHNTRRVLDRFAEGYYQRTMDERLANDRLPNVVAHIRDYDDLAGVEQVDVAFLGNMLHDFYHDEGEDAAVALLRSIGEVVKTGGILGITDHVGIAEQDNAALHRMQRATARRLIEAAGFVIEAESDLYANPADDHTLMVYNEVVYRNTDRFLIRARKS